MSEPVEPPLWVTYVEPERFRVRSQKRPWMKHLVDLSERRPRGLCGCENTQYEPQQNKCVHIRQVETVIEQAKLYCEREGLEFNITKIGSSLYKQ